MADSGRVLVTGGAGFIGSHVVEALVARGHEVAVLDAVTSGPRANLHPKTTLIQADIRDRDAVDAAFADFRPTMVSHHAAQVSVSASTREPAMDADVNIGGSLAVLEACRRHGVEHLTFASTGGALYGEPGSIPCAEAAPIRPLSPYGAAKAAVEGYLWVYRQTWGLPCVALRYANVYGPRQSPHGEAGVVAIFAAAMLRGEAPTVFGTGEDTRDYVYAADVANANVLAMAARLDGAYNVGTGIETSTNVIARTVADAAGYDGPIEHAQARPGDVSRIALDASAFEEKTGWTPAMALEDGIRATVEHLRDAG